MEALKQGSDALFILLGGIMVLAMHAGFAFLELGTVRKKNQVNALVKILVDFSVSTVMYFVVGYGIAYGTTFFVGADKLAAHNGYELVRFFFLLTFAAAIPAIISGGIAERARFGPQLIATAVLVGLVYPLFEGVAWNQAFGIQAWLKSATGQEFHDFAGSVVVHAMGGWLALPAVLLLGARRNRYRKDGAVSAHPPSNIPFLALGAWILTVGWFGFNVMSAQTIEKMSGLVAVNSLMAMVGGTLAAMAAGRNDPGFVHNGPLAGLVGSVRRLRRDASARGAGGGCHRGGHVRFDVHPDAEPLEDRRRPGRLAAARPVRCLGRHRRRHLRAEGAGRNRAASAWPRRLAAPDRHCLGVGRRRGRVRLAQACDGPAADGRGRIRGRGHRHPSDRVHPRARGKLVI